MKLGVIIWGVGTLLATDAAWEFNHGQPAALVQTNEHPAEYCAVMRDGKMVVLFEGKELSTDVFLKNGTTVKPDGTVITREGVRTSLKEGECIDADGKINHVKMNEPYQKEE